MRTYLYNRGFIDLFGSTLWKLSGGDTLKLVLMTSSYSFSSSHEYYTDLTNEISPVGGYSTGGVALTLITPSQDSTNHKAKLDAQNLTISGLVTTFAKGAIINTAYDPDRLICYIDFGGNIVSSGNYTFVWNKRGILDIASFTHL